MPLDAFSRLTEPRLVLLLCALVSASGGCRAQPQPLAAATQGAVRWELIEPVTPEGLAKRETLVLRGTSPVPCHLPRPEDFHLERMGERPIWIPMTFGWSDKDRAEIDYPKGTRAREINLHLRCLQRHEDVIRELRLLARDSDADSVDLYAEAALLEGVRYRLSWSFRLAGTDTVQMKHCEFQIGEAPAEQGPEASFTAENHGVAYLVEVLFRNDDGILFLGQTILPRAQQQRNEGHAIAAVGFTPDGNYVAPPDPGWQRNLIRMATLDGSRRLKPRPAEETRLFGANMGLLHADPAAVAVRISDMATRGPLPTEPGKPTFVAFSSGMYHAVFRVELLDTNVEILRQDHRHWQQRTRAITAELLARRSWIKENGYRLAVVAQVLRDPAVINDLRDALRAWNARGEDEAGRTGFPHHMVNAIAAVGDSHDLRLLEQIAQRPQYASHVAPMIAELTRRIGEDSRPADANSVPSLSIRYHSGWLNEMSLKGGELTWIWYTVKPGHKQTKNLADYDRHEFIKRLSPKELARFDQWIDAHRVFSLPSRFEKQDEVTYATSRSQDFTVVRGENRYQAPPAGHGIVPENFRQAIRSLEALCAEICRDAGRQTDTPDTGTGAPTVFDKWPFDAKEAARRRRETALALGVTKDMTLDLGSDVSMELVLIPAGRFLMGSPATEEDRAPDEPQHEVTLSQPFYMGMHEVTQEQYEQIMGTDPSSFKGKTNPVEQISWEEATAFCRKLSAKTGRTVRLPTEAEWEYSCRAGTSAPFHTGATISTDEANYYGYATYGSGRKGAYRQRTVSVGSLGPNAFGLYDMHGNVWEWCSDRYGESYYGSSPRIDPKGPSSGHYRVLRGGSWPDLPRHCRSAARGAYTPGHRGHSVGFRVAVSFADAHLRRGNRQGAARGETQDRHSAQRDTLATDRAPEPPVPPSPRNSETPHTDLSDRLRKILPEGWRIEGAKLGIPAAQPMGRNPGPGSEIRLTHRSDPKAIRPDALVIVWVMSSSCDWDRESPHSPVDYVGEGRLGHVYLLAANVHDNPAKYWTDYRGDIAVAMEAGRRPKGSGADIVWGKPTAGLQAGIRVNALIEKPSLQAMLVLSVRNAGTKPIRLLRLETQKRFWWRHVPIEVRVDGKVLPYRGPELTPPPSPHISEYVDLAPGATDSAEVQMLAADWELQKLRGAEITFIYANDRAASIASPFDQVAGAYTQVKGLWTGVARSGTVVLDDAGATRKALPDTPGNRAAVKAQAEVSRTRNFMLYGFKVAAAEPDRHWPVMANVGVVNSRFDEVKNIEKDISALIHKRLAGLGKEDIVTPTKRLLPEKELLNAINARFKGEPVRHVYVALAIK